MTVQPSRPGVSALRAWRSAVGPALGALTVRGRAFVAGGLTAAVCGIVLGERDLVRIGVLIVLIPLLTALVSARGGQRLALTRTLAASAVEVDEPTVVTLEITNTGSRTGLLLAEEQVPWALGHRPRFTMGWLGTGGRHTVRYAVRAEVRGVYELGPLLVRIADPFGMLALRRVFPRTAALLVVPGVEELPALAALGAWSGSGENRPQPFSTGSTADSTVRDYRVGDDLRRVHWPSTARTGELMVRREEQPWQAQCTVLLDNRASAHLGSGPDSSLERSITLVASIATHLIGQGFAVRVACADGSTLEHAWQDGDDRARAQQVLADLAALEPTPVVGLVAPPHDPSTTGVVVGVLGVLDAHDREVLARLPVPSGAAYAISVDSGSWGNREQGPAQHGDSSFLRDRGWKTADLTRGGSLARAWSELDR